MTIAGLEGPPLAASRTDMVQIPLPRIAEMIAYRTNTS